MINCYIIMYDCAAADYNAICSVYKIDPFSDFAFWSNFCMSKYSDKHNIQNIIKKP